ncbi:KH domain-containing, RNA-binding, signal transduction-associated protein 2-like isoform X2 [Toxorhynchites rutilus septentrionalis]|uniref:KH domain-containing, RNA-binding, signal transduction-associated protein 2-like isoform X2 n=1 Tax=Toxorhynchites rutilus septentrionalis TaxID=329112 RepID=UPI00247A5E5F|nr:KH domain-containing, RNA-binding, signal transduction-associated protein 2-like isoform X2 [Toxorhynchites rutilus septentrionalis]
MADQDTNGYNDEASDFKRKNNKSQEHDSELEEDRDSQQQSQKAQEYIKGMIAERIGIDRKYPIADRLLEVEIENVQKSGKPPARRYIDIYREKHIKVSVKVLVPVKEHPRFNFVGKLLGPKGNTLKRLQEDTLCKMAILGRGSMKDRKKEEELRSGMDPKYAHLNDDLHVEVNANGPPAEVHARIAYALAELRKYLIPDSNDFIRQEQMRELMEDAESEAPPKKPFKKPMPVETPPPPPPIAVSRPVPAQKKVLSILDKARAAMEDTHGPSFRPPPPQRYEEPAYDHGYEPSYAYHPQGPPPPRAKYVPEAPDYEQEYRREYYREPAPYAAAAKPAPVNPIGGRPWKPSSYAGPPRGGHAEEVPIKHGVREVMPRYRHAPYARPTK